MKEIFFFQCSVLLNDGWILTYLYTGNGVVKMNKWMDGVVHCDLGLK